MCFKLGKWNVIGQGLKKAPAIEHNGGWDDGIDENLGKIGAEGSTI